MRARQFKRIHQPDVPVRGIPQQQIPEKPGMFAGRQRRQEYNDAVTRRAAEEAALDQRYANDLDAFARVGERNSRQADSNRRAAERRQMMQQMPPAVKNNPYAQVLGDRVVDARRFGQEAVSLPGRIHPGYYIGGAAAVGSAGLLNAYSQLQQEELQRGPISTTARATSNALGGIGGMITGDTVGTDPLAEARNSVAEAQDYLGSPTLLEAVVLDQIENKPIENGVAKEDINFVEEVEELARYLLTVPSRNAEGNFVYMNPRDAYSQARQLLELEQQF